MTGWDGDERSRLERLRPVNGMHIQGLGRVIEGSTT
jgi:hypothetical protein